MTIIHPKDFQTIKIPEDVCRGRAHNGTIVRTDDRYWFFLGTHRPKPWSMLDNVRTNDCTVPVVALLDDDMKVIVAHKAITQFSPHHKDASQRTEDYRLFRYKDGLYSNSNNLGVKGAEYHTDIQSIAQIELLPHNTLLYDVEAVHLDFPVQRREKNWSFFEHKGALHIIYSLFPWIVLKHADVHGEFRTIRKIPIDYQIPVELQNVTASDNPKAERSGVPMSLSCNAVECDEGHYAVIIHSRQRCPTLGYALLFRQWMLLIDKVTMLPTHVSPEPFINETGCVGDFPEIFYVSGMAVDGPDVIITAGQGDTYTGWIRVPKSEFEFKKIDVDHSTFHINV